MSWLRRCVLTLVLVSSPLAAQPKPAAPLGYEPVPAAREPGAPSAPLERADVLKHLARQSLGVTLALQRLAAELPPDTDIGWSREALAQAIAEARPEYARAVAAGGLFLLASTPDELIPFREGNSQEGTLDSIVLVREGRFLPVYASPGHAIAGFDVTPERKRLLVVHVAKRQYAGAIVPPGLSGLEVAVVDLETFEAARLPVQHNFNQSLALAFEPPDRLRIRMKDVGNGSDDDRAFFSCRLSALPCTLPEGLPDPADWPPDAGVAEGGGGTAAQLDTPESFPSSGYLEVTAGTGWRVAALPPGFTPRRGMLTRSIRPSPDGKSVAYVTQRVISQGYRDHRLERRLWVQRLPSGKPLQVATGEGWLHAQWLDNDRILFEAEPELSPTLKKEMQRRMPAALKKHLLLASPEERKMLELRLALQTARELKERGEFTGPVTRLGLREFHRTTGKTRDWPYPYVRLWADFQFPVFRPQSGAIIEVPQDGMPKDIEAPGE